VVSVKVGRASPRDALTRLMSERRGGPVGAAELVTERLKVGVRSGGSAACVLWGVGGDGWVS
jgi:hypothetical protein